MRNAWTPDLTVAPDRFDRVIPDMKNTQGCGGLIEAGASAALAKESGFFISNLQKNTEWLDSAPMANALEKSTFSLRDLRHGKASVFLVLPPNYLGQHGRFLRLFIRAAIEAMSPDPSEATQLKERCLFILDEFFSLGYIEEIATTVSSMPSYGVHLFPILHDMGQLVKLYGQEGPPTSSPILTPISSLAPLTGRLSNMSAVPSAPKIHL